MRGSTKVEILKLLRLHEGLSRADLAEALKMNRGNISRSITQMLEDGWVIESGIQPDEARGTQRGQPPTRIEVHSKAFYAVGLSIADEIALSMVNAKGEEIERRRLENIFDKNPEWMINQIVQSIQSMCQSKSGRPLGLGLVSSGNMSKDAEYFFDNHYLGSSENSKLLLEALHKLNFSEVVPELIGNVFPLAEVQRDAYLRKYKTIFCLTDKLDLGLLWEGRMVTCHDTKRFSIKHVKVKNNTQPCFCGKAGCLITIASIWSMMDRLHGYQPGTRGESDLASASRDREDFYRYLQQGEGRIKAMVSIASDAIYEVLENLMAVFQPEVVFIPDWLNLIPEYGVQKIQQGIDEYAQMSKSGYHPKISVQSSGHAQASLGAAILILERHFGQISPYKRDSEWADD